MEPGEGEPADLVIFATKMSGLQQAIEDVRAQIGPETLILSPLNGVESEEVVAKTYGWENIVYSLMRISSVKVGNTVSFDPNAAFYVEYGEKKNDPTNLSERVLRLKALFDGAGIRYQIRPDMLLAIWEKFACNVSENQVAAVLDLPYGAWGSCEDAEALRIMDEKVKNREIEKIYLAAVVGTPRPAAGRLEGYLFKDAKNNQVYVYDAPRTGAKTAVTEYKTIASDGRLTLVECRLITGRTHQIRAQFRHAGCPLLGDGKYGREKDNRAYGEKGQALCSWRLRFVFDTPAGALEYLNGKSFRTKTPEFVEKYFPTFAERMKT